MESALAGPAAAHPVEGYGTDNLSLAKVETFAQLAVRIAVSHALFCAYACLHSWWTCESTCLPDVQGIFYQFHLFVSLSAIASLAAEVDHTGRIACHSRAFCAVQTCWVGIRSRIHLIMCVHVIMCLHTDSAWLIPLQARQQISALLKEGKASTQQGQGQHALELLKQVLRPPSL